MFPSSPEAVHVRVMELVVGLLVAKLVTAAGEVVSEGSGVKTKSTMVVAPSLTVAELVAV